MDYPCALSATQRALLGEAAALFTPPAVGRTLRDSTTLRFGLMTDPQYADVDADVAQQLYYRHALQKLPQAIAAFNQQPLDFVVTLGDIVDRHAADYASVLPLYARLIHPHAIVLGNHDALALGTLLADRAALPKCYYAFRLPGWRFVVYDGNDVSLYCNALNGDDRYQAETLLHALRLQEQPQAEPWNGAVGQQQLAWIEQQFQQAQRCGERVVVFGHYPLAPLTRHNLMNSNVLVDLVTSYNIPCCFAGHDHKGNRAMIGRTGFSTLKGMLNGPDTVPFAVVEISGERVTMQGFGGEASISFAVQTR
ncbi:metallophosphoesterase [Pantoea sp.]|uniref:metallophosphoesterase n=1 Tax=Pantoea sp. TaxID=69393 RepID=UPI0031D2E3D0